MAEAKTCHIFLEDMPGCKVDDCTADCSNNYGPLALGRCLLLSEVKGKDITELIASGREKLASVPSGGGVAVAAAAPGAAAAPAAAETKKEEKEESDDDMSFSLFD
ncbi:60S acidic ribosomal protein P2-4-like [Durio zibethinus]|uniref:60S acidic ribosomal protein P2-4-like n=1 Tax=Durio zibethinus TaxID=66656 RepID=A0A6P5YTS9_DURZI|nr:60S acidic ribosomal protein P2-4-like [Durio zibethinus]